MEIKDTLPLLRTIRGLSQKQLADLVEIDRTYITSIETGRSENPSYRIVKRIAKVLGVSAAVVDGTEPIPGLADRAAIVADLSERAQQVRGDNPRRARMLESLARRLEENLDAYLEYLGTVWEDVEREASTPATDERSENDGGDEGPSGPQDCPGLGSH